MLLKVVVPVVNNVPLMEREWVGLLVPMPTLPEAKTLNIGVEVATENRVAAVVVPIATFPCWSMVKTVEVATPKEEVAILNVLESE